MKKISIILASAAFCLGTLATANAGQLMASNGNYFKVMTLMDKKGKVYNASDFFKVTNVKQNGTWSKVTGVMDGSNTMMAPKGTFFKVIKISSSDGNITAQAKKGCFYEVTKDAQTTNWDEITGVNEVCKW